MTPDEAIAALLAANSVKGRAAAIQAGAPIILDVMKAENWDAPAVRAWLAAIDQTQRRENDATKWKYRRKAPTNETKGSLL